MNLYSIQEIQAIFNSCNTFMDVEKVCTEFRWLIDEGFQQKSDQLQVISLTRFNQVVKNGKA